MKYQPRPEEVEAFQIVRAVPLDDSAYPGYLELSDGRLVQPVDFVHSDGRLVQADGTPIVPGDYWVTGFGHTFVSPKDIFEHDFQAAGN
jgi:hypothetical protein